MQVIGRHNIGLMTQRNRLYALYWLRLRHKPSKRGLVNRFRKVTYPRARMAGPSFPSIRPSRPDIGKFA